VNDLPLALIHNISCSTRIVFCRPSLWFVVKSNWFTHTTPPFPVLEQMWTQISHDHRLRNSSLVVIHSCNFIARLSIWNMAYKIRINNSLLHIFFLSNRFFAYQWTLVLSNRGYGTDNSFRRTWRYNQSYIVLTSIVSYVNHTDNEYGLTKTQNNLTNYTQQTLLMSSACVLRAACGKWLYPDYWHWTAIQTHEGSEPCRCRDCVSGLIGEGTVKMETMTK
jgi:hypothetical protein